MCLLFVYKLLNILYTKVPSHLALSSFLKGCQGCQVISWNSVLHCSVCYQKHQSYLIRGYQRDGADLTPWWDPDTDSNRCLDWWRCANLQDGLQSPSSWAWLSEWNPPLCMSLVTARKVGCWGRFWLGHWWQGGWQGHRKARSCLWTPLWLILLWRLSPEVLLVFI